MDKINLFDEISPKTPATDWKWSFKDYPAKNGLKVFSCFACGGGSTMGYKLAGCDVLGCVEIDPKMNEIYIANHHPRFNYCMDIRQFNAIPDADLPAELFDLDILDGSPPCTTFTMAGKRERSWGVTKAYKEGKAEQTLDDLVYVFTDTIIKLSPKVAILENVEGLLGGNAFEYVRNIHRKLQSAGYVSHHWLLKGEDMGVPQNRHRVFIVAIKATLGIDPSWLDMTFNYEPVPYREIVAGIPRPLSKHSQTYAMLLKAKHGDHRICDVLMRELDKYAAYTDLIAWLDMVAPTMTTTGNIFVGDDARKASSEELVHMQTFPEDFDFMGRPVAYVCGMSVPPIMIKRLVTKLIEQGVFDYKLRRA